MWNYVVGIYSFPGCLSLMFLMADMRLLMFAVMLCALFHVVVSGPSIILCGYLVDLSVPFNFTDYFGTLTCQLGSVHHHRKENVLRATRCAI